MFMVLTNFSRHLLSPVRLPPLSASLPCPLAEVGLLTILSGSLSQLEGASFGAISPIPSTFSPMLPLYPTVALHFSRARILGYGDVTLPDSFLKTWNS